MKKYSVTEKQKHQFASLLLLDEMINHKMYFTDTKDHFFKALEPSLLLLKKDGCVKLEGDTYIPTEEGRELLIKFDKRYQEYLRVFDIYCAVDTSKGEFAFDSYYDFGFDDSNRWEEFLDDERWEDLRIAIMEHKKIDPIEMVFYSFISEGRFDTTKEDWQFELYSDIIWDDIVDICNENLHLEDIIDIIDDVWEKGVQVMLSVASIEDAINNEVTEAEDNEELIGEVTVVTYVEEVEESYLDYDYCYAYMDPFYISPIFVAPLFLY